MKRNSKFALHACITAVLISVVSAAIASTNPPPALKIQEQGITQEGRARTSLAPVIKKVAPSVVNIYSTVFIRERQMPNPFLEDPFLRRFFGEDSEHSEQRSEERRVGK